MPLRNRTGSRRFAPYARSSVSAQSMDTKRIDLRELLNVRRGQQCGSECDRKLREISSITKDICGKVRELECELRKSNERVRYLERCLFGDTPMDTSAASASGSNCVVHEETLSDSSSNESEHPHRVLLKRKLQNVCVPVLKRKNSRDCDSPTALCSSVKEFRICDKSEVCAYEDDEDDCVIVYDSATQK